MIASKKANNVRQDKKEYRLKVRFVSCRDCRSRVCISVVALSFYWKLQFNMVKHLMLAFAIINKSQCFSKIVG